MTRRIMVVIGIFAAWHAGASTIAQQVFRTTTEVVLVPVSVTRGRTPVTGLGREDFQLRDNGVPQEIDAVSLDGKPIDVTFVAGAVFVSQAGDHEHLRQTSDRMRALLKADDRLRILVGGERVREIPMRPVTDAGRLGPDAVRGLGSSLNDALAYALMWPVEADRRHLVIAYTSGLESWSTLAAGRVVQIANRADAVLHAVVPGPPPSTITRGTDAVRSESGTRAIHWYGPSVPSELAAEWRATYDAIDDAVRATGGSLHHVSADAEPFQRVLDEFRSSYVLRYTPRGVDRTGWHEINVRITRPGSFNVRARKGYEGVR